ncbi:MAG: hypothetical protein WKF73_18810 [Nocardioidaceae bacterium]
MGRRGPRASPDRGAESWAPSLAALRLVGDGRSVAMLSPDASVQWWCAPEFDDLPLCWRLLDSSGGTARFPGLQFVDAEDAPGSSATATTLLRDAVGTIEVRDAILTGGAGVVLVRLLRRRPSRSGPQQRTVEHELRLGGFDAPPVIWTVEGESAAGVLESRRHRSMRIRGGRQESRDGALIVTSSSPTARGRHWPSASTPTRTVMPRICWSG